MGNFAGKSPPIAIIGTGPDGVAAIINRLVDIAYNAKLYATPVDILVIDTKDEVLPDSDATYALNGRGARDLHPFYTATPPQGFPTFGEYVDEMLAEDPGLKDALTAPTWRQVRAYLEYMLELAVMTVADLAIVDATATPVRQIRESTPQGPATIIFSDGTSLEVRKAVRARHAPYLTGPVTLRDEVERALRASGLAVDADARSYFLIPAGAKRIAIIPDDGAEELLGSRIKEGLPGIGRIGAAEMWIVTRDSLAEPFKAGFKNDPVQFLSLPQLISHMERLGRADADAGDQRGFRE
jgi:hypothetical protein